MKRPAIVTFITILTSSCLSILLVIFRFHYSSSTFYFFLIWNLFLAWIPYVVSLALFIRYQQTRRLTLIMLGVAGVWLLFYPNAPYILTDLIHLKKNTGVPRWYDSLMIFSFVGNGLLLGFVSLYHMQHIVKVRHNTVMSWIFAGGSLTLASLGIYLGRFMRWNSWDIFLEPITLIKDAGRPFIHPIVYKGTLKITLMYAVFFILTYLLFYILTHVKRHLLNQKD